MSTVARINNDKTLTVNDIYEVMDGFDEDSEIDEMYELDENHELDESMFIVDFISYLFDIEYEPVELEGIRFDSNGDLFVSEIIEEENTFNLKDELTVSEIREGGVYE